MKKLSCCLIACAMFFLPLAGCSDIKEELQDAGREKTFQTVKEIGDVAREGIDEAKEAGKEAAAGQLSGEGGDDASDEDETY